MYKTNEHRVAIVGSGLSGLSAAIDLCNHEIYPIVFEKNNTHGGYATNFIKGGFRFEISLHYVGPLIRDILERLGISHDIGLIDVKKSGVIRCEEPNDVCEISKFKFNDKAVSYVRYLISKYPNEEQSIRKLFSLGSSILPMSDDLIINKTHPLVAMLKHPESISVTSRYINKTSRDLLDELFIDDDLKQEISSLAIILGTPLDVMSAVPYIQTATEHYERGGFYIRGGSQQLVDVMRQRIERSGGTINTNSIVEKIKISNGIIVNMTVNGTIVPVDSVIYCCDVLNLVNSILPRTRIFDSDIRRLPVAASATVVHLGIDVDVKDEYGIDRADYTIKTPEMTFNVAVYSNIDPSCCAPGTSVLTLTGLGYDDFKRRSLNELSRAIPGIDRHIVVSEYLTPTDFEQLTWNTGGSFGGFQTTPSQIHSPVPHKTLIGNLFVAGQWTGVGAGYINTMLGGLDVSSLWQKRML